VTEEELFAETGEAYLYLVHLEDDVDGELARIKACEPLVSNSLIRSLLVQGESWRERLLALVLACLRGVDVFGESLVHCLENSGGISIVPTCAVLTVAVRDFGWNYKPEMIANLNRSNWDGEFGFGLDHFHHEIGLTKRPETEYGPNFGQSFGRHLAFYTKVCKM
jgi:hypothetical protein